MDVFSLDSLWLFLIGGLAGFAGSIVGLGGGFIMIPFLIFLFDAEPELIIGTSMAVLFVNSISSTLAYSRQKKIDFQSGAWFALLMVPGSIVGAMLAEAFSGKIFYVVFGLFLMAVSIFLLVKPNQPVRNFLPATVTREFTDAKGETFTYSFHRGFGMAVSFLTGFVSSLLGIGGGSIMVPTMVLLLSFPPHIATATSMFTIMLSSLVGTISHIALGNVVWMQALYLAPGAFLGGQLGARVAAKLPAKTILRILAVTLILVAIRLIFK
ncbi:sulfite exporter TauE/SafE family protein [Effusibacillus consociatus]|uniref:sulfite exporter TauE/SafE family protein n=1 Tax=Effusibacillus consociatus TaxID=1117041 RepID=UPI0036D32CDE